MQDFVKQAAELQRSGQLAQAARLYESVLARDEANADVLHRLGVLKHQEGQYRRAVELIRQAIAIEPRVAAYWVSLAEGYRALGEFGEAEIACREALRVSPGSHDALCLLASALHALERREEAIDALGRALELRDDFAAAHNYLGAILGELGRRDEALSAFRRAVDLDPASAAARINLGRLLLQVSRAAEALPHLQCAVRLRPGVAELHRNLGNALHGLGRLDEARDAYLDALRLDADLTQARANLSLVMQQQGQLDLALDWLRGAVEADSSNAVFWQQLAELHEHRRERVEAARCWEKMLTLEVHSARGHVAVGRALQKKGHTDRAAEHLRAALTLEPDLAEAYDCLGRLHVELGQVEEAEAAIRASRQLQPDAAGSLRALAMLLGEKLPPADLEALESRARDPCLNEEAGGHLLFALAHVLDARGQYARAADYSRRANRLTLERAQRCGREYVSRDHERFVDAVLAAFSREFLARVRDAGLASRRPIFVFGLPRSGTSMIEQILASHPAIFGAGELLLAPQIFAAMPWAVDSQDQPLDCVARLNAAAITKLAAKHLGELEALDLGRSERIVDKGPQNYQFVGLLAALFPAATFIHCRRDPRDVAVSCWMTDFDEVAWANQSDHIASHFVQHRRLMDHWRSVLPGVIHEVDYEATVEDLEAVARKLVAACGLEWDAACLNFHRTRRAVRTSSATQVRQPIYARSIGRWKHYEAHLADLFARLPID